MSYYEDGRDHRGRWTKGFCPNPNGRPKKTEEVPLSSTDMYRFMTAAFPVTQNGKKVWMSRQELLMNRAFEHALAGKVTAMRFFLKAFRESEETMAKANEALQEMARKARKHQEKTGKFDPDHMEEMMWLFEHVQQLKGESTETPPEFRVPIADFIREADETDEADQSHADKSNPPGPRKEKS